MNPLGEGGVLRLWCQSAKMGRQMLYLSKTLKNGARGFPAELRQFADGLRAKDFAQALADNATTFLFSLYFDHFTLDKKQTKSGGVISLIPLFFSPKYKAYVSFFSQCTRRPLFSSFVFFLYLVCVFSVFCNQQQNSRCLFCLLRRLLCWFILSSADNEIPVAFFPPARTAEQAQNKLYDINRYMGYIYELIEKGLEGDQILWAYPDPDLNIEENKTRLVRFLLAGTFADEPAQADLWELAGDTSRFPSRFSSTEFSDHRCAPPPVDPDERRLRDYAVMRDKARELGVIMKEYEVFIVSFFFLFSKRFDVYIDMFSLFVWISCVSAVH